MRSIRENKTWIVVVRGANTSVFERTGKDGALIRVSNVPAPEGMLPLRSFASFLDAARRARSFERLMLVAPANDLSQLMSDLSSPTRALVTAVAPEVLHTLSSVMQPAPQLT